ncbi:hypothetical protein JNK13_05085 [bacterium]|nr:hypothetical protein [bacterium]
MQHKLLTCLALLGLFAAGPALANDEDVIRRGTLAAITENSVTVADLTCPTNRSTEYEDLNGNTIPRSSFNPGDLVKLKCRSGVAHSLEMEDDIGGGSGSGSGNGGSSGNNKKRSKMKKPLRLSASLSAFEGVPTSARGEAKLRLKNNGSKRDDRFTIEVKVPVPSAVPAANTIGEASALAFTAVISRSGAPYAQCFLRYDHETTLNGVIAAEHKVDVRDDGKRSRSRTRNKKGSCDVDLNQSGVQRGLPFVKRGDEVVIEDSLSGSILKGQF